MTYSTWSNVGIDIETAKGTPLVIVGITKASPPVVTYTPGTDPANGDVMLLSVTGMTQLDERAVRVANVNTVADTFEIEDDDSTNYDTFVSGTATPITFASSMTTVQGLDSTGGEPEIKDRTTIHNQIRRGIPTVVSAWNLAFVCLWNMADAAHIELRKATRELTTRVLRIRYSNGVVLLANGFISAPGIPTGEAHDLVKTNVTVTMQGMPSILS